MSDERLIYHPWLSVLTTPERPEYLQATLEALDLQGAREWRGEKLIAVDGNAAAVPQRSSWSRHAVGFESRAAGTSHALLTIIRAASADDAPYLLYFEDDIRLSRNAVEYMMCIQVPDDVAFLSFCDIARNANPLAGPGGLIFRAAPTEARPHWGNQALKIPGRTLDRVRAKPDNWFHRDQSDVLLADLAVTAAAPWIGYVVPSIVDHVGARSVVHPDKGIEGYGRSPHNFAGVDFDAMSLEVRE